jgi:hypothetical protein
MHSLFGLGSTALPVSAIRIQLSLNTTAVTSVRSDTQPEIIQVISSNRVPKHPIYCTSASGQSRVSPTIPQQAEELEVLTKAVP